jgi:hypothetical protein
VGIEVRLRSSLVKWATCGCIDTMISMNAVGFSGLDIVIKQAIENENET